MMPQKQKQLKDELESPEIQRQLVEIFDKVLKKIAKEVVIDKSL